jgi:hypothetical protein
MVNCDCPYCGSTRTQALSVLHTDGVREYAWTSDSLFYYRRAFGLRLTAGRGRSRSPVVELARPPVPATRQLIAGGFGTFLVVICTLLAGWSGFWFAVICLIVLAVFGGRAESVAHAQALEHWRASFRCARCGTIFRAS